MRATLSVIASATIAIAAALLAPGPARAEPILTLEPDAGPCHATVTATGTGFPPGAEVELALGRPDADTEVGTLALVIADGDRSFVVAFSFATLGCPLLAPRLFQLDHFSVYADQANEPDDLVIYTRAVYELTSQELPATGSGVGSDDSRSLLPLAFVAIAAGALLIIAANLRRISFT